MNSCWAKKKWTKEQGASMGPTWFHKGSYEALATQKTLKPTKLSEIKTGPSTLSPGLPGETGTDLS